MAYTTLVAGTTITAAWANASVRDQSVSPFASAAARSSAISSPVEGMVTHLNDTNSLGVYSGAAWSHIGPVHGALLTWTPTWTQSATITKTVNAASYSRVGRTVNAWFRMSATSAGTASQPILFGLPVAHVTGSGVIGTVALFDASGGNWPAASTGLAYLQSGTTFGILATGGASAVAISPTIASGDIVEAQITYEAAADA